MLVLVIGIILVEIEWQAIVCTLKLCSFVVCLFLLLATFELRKFVIAQFLHRNLHHCITRMQ